MATNDEVEQLPWAGWFAPGTKIDLANRGHLVAGPYTELPQPQHTFTMRYQVTGRSLDEQLAEWAELDVDHNDD